MSVDPLGGSYYVESLTSDFETRDQRLPRPRSTSSAARCAAIEHNCFQREIADFAYDFALRKAGGDAAVVGVNKFVDTGDDQEIEVHKIDPTSERRKIERLQEIKRTRDNDLVRRTLAELLETAKDPDANLMPATIAAVRAHASMGEIVNTLEGLFGRYRETPVF